MNNLTDLPSNWQCHKQVFRLVWGTSCCPGRGGKLLFRSSYEWCKYCRRKTSVKSETIFRHANLSCQKLWLLIYCWQQKVGIGETRKVCGVSYPTIRIWFRRFRQALPTDTTVLSGLVEVDESAFGKRKFKTAGQQWVMGAIERDTRRIKLAIIPNRKRDTLENFIRNKVREGSHINTDAWYAYSELNLLGYTHEAFNHSKGHFSETNQIEGLWSVMKRHLRHLYRDLSLPDLTLILKEWEIRQNQPEMMYTVPNYLRATGCSGLFQ